MDFNDHLAHKYPDYRPCDRAPTLFTLNGVGLAVYGRGAQDPETGTYQKMRAAVVFFIPILFLGSYRVADAENGGWYFVGKHGLPTAAKLWNALVFCLAATAVLVTLENTRAARPEAKAQKQLKEGRGHEQAGDAAAAARCYAAVLGMALLDGDSAEALEAESRLHTLAETVFASEVGADLVPLFTELVALQQVPHRIRKPFPDLAARGDQLAARLEPAHPGPAYRIWQMVLTLNPDHPDGRARTERLARAWTAAAPESVEAAEHLAGFLEAQDTEAAHAEIYALLHPIKDRLADGEGARILGGALMARGEIEAAYPLLQAYVAPRLEAYRRAEDAWETLYTAVQQATYDDLNNNRASSSFYIEFQKADDETRQTMVNDYHRKALERHPYYEATLKALEEASPVVPVALDLGIAQVTRARTLADAEARRREMALAEQTFATVQHAAAGDPTFDLFMGQVKYWLGKYDEGAALFEAYLRAQDHAPEAVLQLLPILREVGERETAITMVTRAYDSTRVPEMRATLAEARAILATTREEALTWLERADTGDPSVKAAISYNKGLVALEADDPERAEKWMRQAAEAYLAMTTSTASLNNAALAYQTLFALTHHPDDATRAAELMGQALAMQPDNALLLHNTTRAQLMDLVARFFSDLEEPHAADLALDLTHLRYFYNSADEEQHLRARLNAFPGVKTLRANFARLLVLSPKDPSLYVEAVDFFQALGDQAGLADVAAHFQAAQLSAEALTTFSEGNTATQKAPEEPVEPPGDMDFLYATEGLSPRARALAGIGYIFTRLAQAGSTPINDMPELTTHMRAIDQSMPSRGSRTCLIATLLNQTHQTLLASVPTYRDLYPAAPAPLDPDDFIFLLLALDHPLAADIRADVHFREAVDIGRTLLTDFPHEPSVYRWALLRHTEDGARPRAMAEADQAYLPRVQMEQALHQRETNYQVSAMLAALMQDDRAGAKALADTFRKTEPGFPQLF